MTHKVRKSKISVSQNRHNSSDFVKVNNFLKKIYT